MLKWKWSFYEDGGLNANTAVVKTWKSVKPCNWKLVQLKTKYLKANLRLNSTFDIHIESFGKCLTL